MYLSDRDIREALRAGDITIGNFDRTRLQPASYDILLGYEFLMFNYNTIECIDPGKPIDKHMTRVTLKSARSPITLHPKQLILGVSYDRIGVGRKHCYSLMGKSSLARLGLIIHTTAGFVDPGNELNVTLELFNTNSVPMKLYPKMKIGQVAFFELKSSCERPYGHKELGSKYYRSTTVEASKMHLNNRNEPTQRKK